MGPKLSDNVGVERGLALPFSAAMSQEDDLEQLMSHIGKLKSGRQGFIRVFQLEF